MDVVATELSDIERDKSFLRVYALLIQTAENRDLVTYSRIAEIMGLSTKGSYMGSMTGKMLGAIVDRERECGRPMLSAVAVSSTNQQPGSGFYGLAEQYGLIPAGASTNERREFWRAELEQVYQEWSS